MKKLLILICSLALSCFIFFGCAGTGNNGGTMCGGAPIEPILANKPWTNSNNYEYACYDITRYEAEKTETDFRKGDTLASGTYTTELFTVRENIYNSDVLDKISAKSAYFKDKFENAKKLSQAPGSYSVLFSEYKLDYNDGKKDVLSSVVVFKSSSLIPVFSEKVANYQSSGLSYTATADYANKKNIFQSSESGVKSEVDLKNEETSFDNELMNYVIRSHSSLKSGGSSSISLRNSVYTGLNGSEEYRTMAFKVMSGNYAVTGIDADKTGFVSRYFNDGDVTYLDKDTTDTDGNEVKKGYQIPCHYVQAMYNNTNSGTPKYLYYASCGFDYVGDTTSKVLLQSIDFETDETGVVSAVTLMTINDYKTSQSM